MSGGLVASANAAVIYSNTTATGDTQLPGSYDYTFSSSATSAITSIQLQGYNTLDGQNFYEDDFTLSLNGTAIYKATFDLGGGGADVVFTSPSGSSFTKTGQTVDLLVPVALANGFNTLTLSYDSLPQPDHAGYQGIGDEGFGINSVSVVSAVPLPASAPMFGAAILGLAGLSYVAKRKKAAAAA